MSSSNSSAVNISAQHPLDPLSAVSQCLPVFVLLISVLILVVAALNAFLVLTSHVLHPNLKCILVAQSAAIATEACCYGVNVLLGFGYLLPITVIVVLCLIFCNMIGHILFIERVIATVRAAKYEHDTRLWFSATWISGMFCMLLFSALHSDTVNSVLTNSAYLNLASLALSLCECIGIALVLVYNANSRQNGRLDQPLRYQLSAKYQTVENVRTARQLAPTFFLHFVNILTANLTTLVLDWRLIPEKRWMDIYVGLLVALTAICNLGIEVTIITKHPIIARRLRPFVPKFGRVSPAKEEVAAASLDKSGRNRSTKDVGKVHTEQDRYFEMLAESWK